MYEIIFSRSTRGSCSYRSGRGQENYRDETWGLPSRSEARPKELTDGETSRMPLGTMDTEPEPGGLWLDQISDCGVFFASIVDGRCEKKNVATSGTLLNQLYGL